VGYLGGKTFNVGPAIGLSFHIDLPIAMEWSLVSVAKPNGLRQEELQSSAFGQAQALGSRRTISTATVPGRAGRRDSMNRLISGEPTAGRTGL
jgi:hypothetical protein